MGFIRGFFLVIVSVLLFLSLISMAFCWTLSDSLSYNNLEKQSVGLVQDLLNNTNLTHHIHMIYPAMLAFCQNNSNYVFSFEGSTFDVPCQTVLMGENAIIGESVKSQIHEIYYTNYSCNFLDCFGQSQLPFFLISEKAYNFWSGNLNLFLIISFILSVLLFFLAEKKTNVPILIGSLLVVSSLPFLKLDVILSLFSDQTVFKLLWIFVSQSFSVALKILIAGIILIAIGIVLKVFKIGFSIEQFLLKFKKPEVKQKIIEKPIQKQIVKKPIKKPMKKSK